MLPPQLILSNYIGLAAWSICSKKLEQISYFVNDFDVRSASNTDLTSLDNANDLDDWESAVIDLFLNAANSFGLPKSYGQIYGLLFCRDESLAMDEVMELLKISKVSSK